MSKMADRYTDIFDVMLAAEASYAASFDDDRKEIKDQSDLCRMSAYNLMLKANRALLETMGLSDVYGGYKRSFEET